MGPAELSELASLRNSASATEAFPRDALRASTSRSTAVAESHRTKELVIALTADGNAVRRWMHQRAPRATDVSASARQPG